MSDKQPTPQLVSVAQDLVRERDELRAEVEQLKADYNAAYTNYVTQRDEAERLRVALEQIMLNAPLNSPERITASRALGRAKE